MATSPIGKKEIIIHDGNAHMFIDPVHDGEVKKCGTIPRDFAKYPVGYLMCAKPFDLPLIPESDWQARLDAQIASKSQLSNLRNVGNEGSPVPSRDQNGVGYCWCHSGVSAHLLVRCVNHEPYVDLSPFSIGCKIKNYRDEGGWGAEGVEFQAANGVATSATWPQKSMARTNDNAAEQADAAKHKITEWMDLADSGTLVKQQLVTCLLLCIPVVVDYNWWSHSVCAMDLVSLSPFRIRIWNSWADSWSENGTGLLEGNKAIPNGALAPRVVSASAA